jgi:hypothetical protein
MRLRLATSLVVLAAVSLPVEAVAEVCKGCACRGGPGYRDARGQCVGHAQLYSRCGVPPTTRCTFEGTAQVGRTAVPPEWPQAQHAAWLASRNAARLQEAVSAEPTR